MKTRIAISVSSLLIVCSFLLIANAQPGTEPSIEFTRIPFTDKGGTEAMSTIEGRVVGAKPGQRIVLFAKSGAWYVQPFVDQPFTIVETDGSWKNRTHLGTDYAALLVAPGYLPPNVADVLPPTGGLVIAEKMVPGTPFFWQTRWFPFLLAVAGFLTILFLFRWRQVQLMRELNLRFEERLAERTRIAQDLHDTLLQGLLSASLQLHVADEQLSAESPAKPIVGRVLKLMGQVVDEGHNAVRGLRTSGADSLALEHAFSQIPFEVPMEKAVDYKLTVKGTSRQLRPAISGEVYRLGHEALVNALRHSQATRIELEIEYTAKHFRILVRDNGIGINSKAIEQGDHVPLGLAGMRERADGIGGQLTVWSKANAGTEIELTIASQLAYESGNMPRRWFDG